MTPPVGRGGTWLARALATALTLGITLAGHGQGNDKGATRMDARDQLSAKLQALPDEVYLRKDRSAVSSLPREALSLRFQGLALGAPRVVDLASTQAVPALLIASRTAARSAELDWHRNAIVMASDVDRGDVFAGEAFVRDPSKAPDTDPRREQRKPAQATPPSQDAARGERGDGNSAGTAWLDFRDLLKLPAESRRWALRVLYFDEVSNPALVEVKGKSASPGAMSPDDAAKLVARMRSAGHRDGLPRYFRTPETPQLQSAGIAAALGPVAAKGGARQIPLHAAMRLEVSPQTLIQQAAVAAAPGQRPPAAVLRVMVLVLIKDRNIPVRIPLEIPVWSDRPLKPGDLVEAVFSIDLADAMPKAAAPGTYQVYVVGGRYLSGPHALAL
jgi:hypothetical protein